MSNNLQQLSAKTVKTLREFAKVYNISLKKLTLKKDIVHKIHEWCVEDNFQKLIKSNSITDTIKSITNDFKDFVNLTNSINLLMEHKDLQLVLNTLLQQNFSLDYSQYPTNIVTTVVRNLLNSCSTTTTIKKKIISCILFKFQLENMNIVVDHMTYRQTMLDKVKEFRKEQGFHSINWDESINKFIDNHKKAILNALTKKNVCSDVQTHVILKFLF
jgi:hypothetical protein